MNIKKADYGTVIKFGNLELLNEKMEYEKRNIDEIKNIVDVNGVSLLDKALVSRKFEIANYLLDRNVHVNVISKEGRNELHYLAVNINCDGAIDVANRLIDLGVDLDLTEKKYGNTAMFDLCMEVFKERTDGGISLLIKCLKKKPNIKLLNYSGFSVESIIMERGGEQLKEAIKDIFYK